MLHKHDAKRLDQRTVCACVCKREREQRMTKESDQSK